MKKLFIKLFKRFFAKEPLSNPLAFVPQSFRIDVIEHPILEEGRGMLLLHPKDVEKYKMTFKSKK